MAPVVDSTGSATAQMRLFGVPIDFTRESREQSRVRVDEVPDRGAHADTTNSHSGDRESS
jgi:hypothetical protein